MPHPMIVGHRGVPRLAKENTIASFAKAIEIGAAMIEFDVRRTKDLKMVVYHNPVIGGRPLAQLTHREANDLAASQGIVIPTVEEVLALTQHKIKLDVELKEAGYEKEILDLIGNYFPSEEFVVTSFLDPTVAAVKQYRAAVKAGLLLDYGPSLLPLLLYGAASFLENRYRSSGTDFLAVHHRLLKFGLLNPALHPSPLYVWTVDEPAMMDRLLSNPQIAAVITNKPDLALSLTKSLE